MLLHPPGLDAVLQPLLNLRSCISSWAVFAPGGASNTRAPSTEPPGLMPLRNTLSRFSIATVPSVGVSNLWPGGIFPPR